VGEALETFKVPYVAIEIDPDIIRGLRARGIVCLFGDASGRKLLEAAGATGATLAVVALPDIDRTRLTVRELRAMNPRLSILARAAHRTGLEELRAAGATEVIQPEQEAAEALIRYALRRLALPSERLAAYLERFHAAMVSADETRRADGTLPEVREVVLGPGLLADQSLREARIRERFGVTVVAVTRADGDFVPNPPAELILRPGDRLRMFGLPAQFEAFLAEAGKSIT